MPSLSLNNLHMEKEGERERRGEGERGRRGEGERECRGEGEQEVGEGEL